MSTATGLCDGLVAQLAVPDVVDRLKGQIRALEAEVEALRAENKRPKARRR